MRSHNRYSGHRLLLLLGILMSMAFHGHCVGNDSPSHRQQLFGEDKLDRTYRRLLPLEGGSNFRDMGGYLTTSGQRVKRGLLFRSGAPTSLTEADMAYLSRFGFQTAVDLRSNEERALFPNHWVDADQSIDYRYVDYSIMGMMKRMEGEGTRPPIAMMYGRLPEQIAPQLRVYFDALLAERTPIVVNCSAGQDRTGVTAALVLLTLGVPRALVIEDYLLSTDFRRPALEVGDVDLEASSQTNDFAKLMLAYKQSGVTTRANPLVTEEGTAYLEFALNQIEHDYGSVDAYLMRTVGLSEAQLASLKVLYLEDDAISR